MVSLPVVLRNDIILYTLYIILLWKRSDDHLTKCKWCSEICGIFILTIHIRGERYVYFSKYF